MQDAGDYLLMDQGVLAQLRAGSRGWAEMYGWLAVPRVMRAMQSRRVIKVTSDIIASTLYDPPCFNYLGEGLLARRFGRILREPGSRVLRDDPGLYAARHLARPAQHILQVGHHMPCIDRSHMLLHWHDTDQSQPW